MTVAEIAKAPGAAARRIPALAALPRELTPREKEVLHWIAEGKTNAAIAAILGLSAYTVKGYVEQILEKLGVENRTCAARVAFESEQQYPRHSADTQESLKNANLRKLRGDKTMNHHGSKSGATSKPSTCGKLCSAVVLLLAVGAITGRADTFTLDPTQSTLTISGSNAIAGTIIPQGANSLTTSYSGTINATVAANSITFNSAAAMAAINGNWQPAPGMGAGTTAPADYGIAFTNSAEFSAYGAVRGLTLDLTSGAIPLTAGAFDASNIFISASSGTTDYTSILGNGSVDLTTLSAKQNTATAGTLTMSGNVETLTIPINITETLSIASTNDTTVTFTGDLVATETIPEPSTGALLLVACAAAAVCVSRRHRAAVTKRV